VGIRLNVNAGPADYNCTELLCSVYTVLGIYLPIYSGNRTVRFYADKLEDTQVILTCNILFLNLIKLKLIYVEFTFRFS